MKFNINGTLMLRDYVRFGLYKVKNLIFFQTILIIFIVFLLLSENTSFFLSLLLYISFPFLNIIFVILTKYIQGKQNYKSLDTRFHRKIIKINEDGIEYGTKGNLGIFHWSDIRKGVFLKEITLLYISTEEAILIPRHFFSTLEEEEKCVNFIKSHLPN